MKRYLNQVKKIWNHIIADDNNLCFNLDMTTVQLLKSRCSFDQTDRTFIKSHRQNLFSIVLNVNQRRAVFSRIMSIKIIISFIHTFLENTKYLEICVKILKVLISKPLKGTLHQNFQKLHNGQKTISIQLTEVADDKRTEISVESVHWKVYRQLWLYVMRHFSEMTDHSSRIENAKSKMKMSGLEYSWWYGIAELAKRCGYQEIQVSYSSEADVDEQMTRDFLRRVRSSSLYTFKNFNLDQTIGQIMAILEKDYLARFTNGNNQELISCDADINHRCEVPFWSSFYVDRSNLFLSQVYSTHSSGHVATTFSVKSTMFKNFFGYIYLNGSEVLDFGNELSTNVIASKPSQSSQTPEAASASRIGEQISTGGTSSMPIGLISPMSTEGTSPMPIDGTTSMAIDGTTFMPIDGTSLMPTDVASLMLTGGASHTSTATAQNAELGQARLDKWFQSQSTLSNGTSIVTQRLYRDKQAKIAQTRFMRASRSHPKEVSILKMKQLDTGVRKQQAIDRYLNIQSRKDGSALYLIKENCANEHFSIYKCASENIGKIFELLESRYVYSVSIKQVDRSGFSTAGPATTKKKKISSLHNIANNRSYCVLAVKLSTQISFEEDKLKRIQSSEQQQQSTFDEEL